MVTFYLCQSEEDGEAGCCMWEHTSGHCSKQDAEVETAVHNYFKFKITNGDLIIYWPEKIESVKVT